MMANTHADEVDTRCEFLIEYKEIVPDATLIFANHHVYTVDSKYVWIRQGTLAPALTTEAFLFEPPSALGQASPTPH